MRGRGVEATAVHFERNFKETSGSVKFIQETLVEKSSRQKVESNTKSKNTRLKKYVACNYSNEKRHWVLQCTNWIADGRPFKKKEESNVQGTVFESNTFLVTNCSEAYLVESNCKDW